MNYRRFGIVFGVVALVALAGCSGALGGDDGDDCGPGDTEIEELEAGEVSITGEVTDTGDASITVDDGTGTAFVSGEVGDVESGDCVTVEGQATPLPGEEADANVAASDVSEA